MRTPALDFEALSSRQQASRASQLSGVGVARLTGNVGRLTLDDRAPLAAAALLEAMAALETTDSLIIDVRHCRDLHPAMAALLCSVLFDTAAALHDECYVAPGARPTSDESGAHPRYIGKPVVMLVGARTGRVAAALARNLARMRRAGIIGEWPRDEHRPADERRKVAS